MTHAPRHFIIAALAALPCLTAITSACTRDEPATYVPRAGAWTYEVDSVVSNSCEDIPLPESLMTLNVDYDGDDEFQIELGANDVVCEIDGTEFYCGAYDLGSEAVPGFDAVIQVTMRWDGEFSSDTLARGNELTSVTCTGEDCNLLDNLPCSRDVEFTAEFAN